MSVIFILRKYLTKSRRHILFWLRENNKTNVCQCVTQRQQQQPWQQYTNVYVCRAEASLHFFPSQFRIELHSAANISYHWWKTLDIIAMCANTVLIHSSMWIYVLVYEIWNWLFNFFFLLFCSRILLVWFIFVFTTIREKKAQKMQTANWIAQANVLFFRLHPIIMFVHNNIDLTSVCHNDTAVLMNVSFNHSSTPKFNTAQSKHVPAPLMFNSTKYNANDFIFNWMLELRIFSRLE